MTEQFANKADSTLNGAINNSTTTIVVNDGSRFPSTGDFRVLLGPDAVTGEIVIATARSGNTLTVTRGQESTTAQSWSDGTSATHILTAGAVITLQQIIPGSITENFTTKTLSIDPSATLASSHGDGTSRLYVSGKILSTSYSAGEIPLTTQGFGYVSDALQTFTVPSNVTSIKVKMWGPGGGTANWSGSGGGGPGGYSTGYLSVTPGETLYLAVGSGGKKGTINTGPGGLGGWPGGGWGSAGDSTGGGGGGLSGIFNTSLAQTNALMIAGGGGGASGFGNFGAGGGGGTTGGSGTGTSGQGATQTAGGKDGNGNGASVTTIAAASNGQSLPQSTINVVSTTGFPTVGIIFITTSAGVQTVTYTGTTSTTFTGASGGTGTMSTGGAVTTGGTTIASGSNGQSLPQSTINVGNTGGFPTSGTLLVTTSAGRQVVGYTGTTTTTFTGCTLGTGTMSTGNAVTLASAGTALTGGIGFKDTTTVQVNDDGGGGSGYWGGGAGQGDGRSGGGGSGFLHPTRVSLGSMTTGNNAASGAGTTNPPNTTDVNYISGIGVGAAASGTGNNGGDGYIVLQWGGITTIDLDSIDFGNTSSISTLDTNITISSAPAGIITLAPGSGTVTLQSTSDAILSSGTQSLVINSGSTQRFKTYSTGAVIIGGADVQNDTSAEAQAGLTGPLINLSSSTGSISSVTNQATIFNQSGVLALQGNTDVRFYTGSTLRGGWDSAGFLRAGPSATSTASAFGGTNNFPQTTTDYFYMYNSSGSSWASILAGSTTTRAACEVLNTGAGGSATVGAAIFAGGTSHATAEYAGNGVLEQSGATTSGLIFTKMVGNGTGFASTGAIWQTGAWAIGRTATNSSSALAQAGLTGPMINIGAATGTFTSAANQALNFNIAGSHHIQGATDVRFDVGTTLAGYFDSNGSFRVGPNAATQITQFTSDVVPDSNTESFYSYNATNTNAMLVASGATANRSIISAANTGAGTTSTVALRVMASGTTEATTGFAGNGILEQHGASTSCLLFSKTLGDGTSRATLGRIYQSGAWSIGDAIQNDTSAEAQAGLTGPLLNISQITGGSLTSTANQTLLYNNAGTTTWQGHVGHTLVANTTTVASTSTSKFITNVGRRVKTNVQTTNYTVTTSDEVIIVGTLASSITITLPTSPTAGDTYTIKDQGGGSAANNIIVSGNGNNIDGAASYTINTNYQSITLVFANGTWSIV